MDRDSRTYLSCPSGLVVWVIPPTGTRERWIYTPSLIRKTRGKERMKAKFLHPNVARSGLLGGGSSLLSPAWGGYCPILAGGKARSHWEFTDPLSVAIASFIRSRLTGDQNSIRPFQLRPNLCCTWHLQPGSSYLSWCPCWVSHTPIYQLLLPEHLDSKSQLSGYQGRC